MRTLTVYVKHYLTDPGKEYFKKVWYPKVYSTASQQEGFISLEYKENNESPDCLDLTLKFKDENTLNAWIDVPEHDALIQELDIHRSRGYWKAVSTTDAEIEPSKLKWEVIQVHS